MPAIAGRIQPDRHIVQIAPGGPADGPLKRVAAGRIPAELKPPARAIQSDDLPVSEIELGLGFRDSNSWLLALTNNRLPLVYAGDALGSFNSWARLITGVLAGVGIVWFAFPQVERSFAQD